MLSRRTLFGWIALGVFALATSGALAYTLVRLDEVNEEARDLKGRVRQLREMLSSSDPKTGAAGATFDWRSLVRRVERLESASGAPAEASGAARPVAAATARVSAAAGTAGPVVDPALPSKLLEAEPFRAGLQEIVKTGMKKTMEERRAAWTKRFDDRLQQEIQTFAKSNNLSEPQAQSMQAILQDDRDQRREIRRQFRQGELDSAATRKQLDALNTSTKQRIVEQVGESGYQAYQKQRQEQRQMWRSLRRF